MKTWEQKKKEIKSISQEEKDEILEEAGKLADEIKPPKTKAQILVEQIYAKNTMNQFARWKMSRRGR